MAIRLYLDEDVDPFLAQILRSRGVDCLSTQDASNLGHTNPDQLTFAIDNERAILTFNVKDFVQLASTYTGSGQQHSGIIVSDHLPFRELLRRTLILLQHHVHDDLTDKILWLQNYKEPDFPDDSAME